MSRIRLEYNGEFIGILNIPFDGMCATLQINDRDLDRIKFRNYIKKAFKKLDEFGYKGEILLTQPYAMVSKEDWILQNLVTGQKAMSDLGHELLMKVRDKTKILKVKTDVWMERR